MNALLIINACIPAELCMDHPAFLAMNLAPDIFLLCHIRSSFCCQFIKQVDCLLSSAKQISNTGNPHSFFINRLFHAHPVFANSAHVPLL
jgi:hypothetical protein